MATRSKIGVELKDGTVKAVYCHWDGYPQGVGAGLIHMGFNSTEDVEAFINEGDRSTIDLSYGEWRGEDCPPRTYPSVEEYFASDLEEWGYLFTRDGEWIVKDMYSDTVLDPKPVQYFL